MAHLPLASGLRAGLAAAALLALLVATLAPVFAARGRVEAVGLYMALDPLCHQRADRCWRVAGRPAGLCVRCYGVYGGVAAALLIGAGLSRRGALGWAAAAGGLWALENLSGSSAVEAFRLAGGGVLGVLAVCAGNPWAARKVRNDGTGGGVEDCSAPIAAILKPVSDRKTEEE